MGKFAFLRSLYRSTSSFRSLHCSVSAAAVISNQFINGSSRLELSRSFFSISSPSTSIAPSHTRVLAECRSPFATGLGSARAFSEDVTHMPDIKDPEIKNVFKDFMAVSWDELPSALIHDALKVLSKETDDKSGKEVLTNVFRAAEAVEEFTGMLVSLRMEFDDSVGLSGENVKPMSDEFVSALRTVFDRYTTYLNSFGPEETYLKKKIETEVGTRMIHLKMRCSSIGSEWGKVTVLGTSGLSGSYVEQRGP